MNANFDHAKGAFAQGLMNWIDNDFRWYAADLAQVGSADGGGVINNVVQYNVSSTDSRLRVSTVTAHGLAVGDLISMVGAIRTNYPIFVENEVLEIGQYRRPTSAKQNGKKYRVVKAGTTSGEPGSWSSTEGRYEISGGVIFQCEGSDTLSPHNGLHRVLYIASAAQFDVNAAGPVAYWSSGGHIANLSRTYLSQFAPAANGALSPASEVLTGKVVLAGSRLDATNNPSIDLTGRPVSHALILVKTAETSGGATLPEASQRLVTYVDTAAGLPFAANAGIVALTHSNDTDRITRL